MTHLRRMMLDELQRRNYAQNTVRSYIHAVEEFAAYFRRPPDQLGPEHIRTYQVHLFRDVAPSKTDDGLKVIVANPVMINADNQGIPGDGKPVPDGAMMAKIEWTGKKNPESPYSVLVPDTLKRVGLMVKNSKRFADTNGWGYAQFVYHAASDTFTQEESDPSFGKKLCHTCHTLVKAKDFVFAAYPVR